MKEKVKIYMLLIGVLCTWSAAAQEQRDSANKSAAQEQRDSEVINTSPRGGMVDALVSGASVERRASSILVVGTYTKICGNSSVGRAQPCQGWGREFESRFPLQSEPIRFTFFVLGISLHKLRIFLYSMIQIVDKFAA